MTADQAKSRRGASVKPNSTTGRGRKGAPKNNPAGRPTLAELERRKARVMQVATALFVSEGYAATTLVDIAKRSGVATRTLYQHFGDKEAIFHDVMYARETAAVFPAPEPSDGEPLFDVVMLTAQYVCDVTFRPTTVDMMRLAIAESQRFPEMMERLVTGSHARFNANVRHVFDELVDAGIVQDADTTASAEMFIHLILGDTPLLVFGGWKAPLPSREQLTQKVDLFIMGRWGAIAARNAHKPPPKKAKRSAPATS